jgi:Domain of unknown function (DUF4249)
LFAAIQAFVKQTTTGLEMKRIVILFLCTLLITSCIDRINITIPDSSASQLVVDGLITDEPGPYTVRLSLATRVDGFLQFRKLITAGRVTIFDNLGNSEDLTLIEAGTYQTKPNGIRGMVGRAYAVRIETVDGKVYESIPDMMNPSGSLDSVYYKRETFQPLNEPTRYGLRVYTDGRGVPDGDNLFRWKYTGTYQISTYPLQHKDSRCAADPRACGSEGGICTCCDCWVNQYAEQPYISDNQFVSNGNFKNIEVAYVPIEYIPFEIKYRMEVKQMSLSRAAFDYWKTIQSQKEGGSSLFQPPTGKTRTNIFEKNGLTEAQGIFYASSVSLKQTYVANDLIKGLFLDIPIVSYCAPPGEIQEDCRLAFPHSTTTKPHDWK